MKWNKKTVAEMLVGILGGIFIAAGALSAIGFTENAVNCVPAIVLLIIGAFIGIILDMVNINRCFWFIISIVAFVMIFFSGMEYARFFAAGLVMYTGCALALPEKDVFTNAIRGASAAAGFIVAVITIL